MIVMLHIIHDSPCFSTRSRGSTLKSLERDQYLQVSRFYDSQLRHVAHAVISHASNKQNHNDSLDVVKRFLCIL